ncbi:carboxypeptidase regulatory-like domain-containing protein [Phytohabitans rumicis]|uniref:carboxypeptidase regulatory-like domain-containing protein n=1 Tax=Phytohabitans rumicis TaxID=1076125 RepID=UPI001566CEFF|nr:carboxypeptidase regulatory-like domain-containing protein [Phytohabitans rumicis]
MTDDQMVLRAVHDMWESLDPVPVDLADRVLFTLQLEDLEFELMRLQEALAPMGARGAETASTVTFSAESLTVMVTVSDSGPHHRRIDGWIAPGGALRVELRTPRGVHETHADADGRFAFAEVPSGLVQIMIHPTNGATVPLHRPVVTPPVQL